MQVPFMYSLTLYKQVLSCYALAPWHLYVLAFQTHYDTDQNALFTKNKWYF